MSKTKIKADICIIGAGSAGLSVAAGAAQLGLNTVLIERDKMGGDCLNTGCVPSKALLAAAKRAHTASKDDIAGIKTSAPKIDYAKVKDYVASKIKVIEPHDSPERFRKLGVNVILEEARFTDKKTVETPSHIIKARQFVIATGARAFQPPIKGLDKNKALTNESIFELREKPEHLIIIGGGAIGIEMAQAHVRLGCKVTLFDQATILQRDDAKNVAILRKELEKEGVTFFEKAQIKEIKHTAKRVTLHYKHKGKDAKMTGSHLLVAAGRQVNVHGLGLENAGVNFTNKGIEVDAHLKTSNSRIFAIGDVIGGPQFTHIAGYHAGLIIRQVCFGLFWTKTDYKALPWVTYSDPELAQVGLTEAQAREKYGDDIKVVTSSFSENDRAITESQTVGQLRVVTDKKGVVLGASMVGAQAGELIQLWGLAISQGLKISAVAGMISPYPTLGEINKRAAGAWYTPSLFSDKTKRIVKVLKYLG